MVAAVVDGQQLIRMLRIAHHSVEIDHRVEVSRQRESIDSPPAGQLRSADRDDSKSDPT